MVFDSVWHQEYTERLLEDVVRVRCHRFRVNCHYRNLPPTSSNDYRGTRKCPIRLAPDKTDHDFPGSSRPTGVLKVYWLPCFEVPRPTTEGDKSSTSLQGVEVKQVRKGHKFQQQFYDVIQSVQMFPTSLSILTLYESVGDKCKIRK